MENKILVIDDESEIRSVLRKVLVKEGWEVVTAASGEEGLALLETHSPSAVFLDLMLPGISGVEMLREIKQRRMLSEVVIMTGAGTVESAVETIKMGAYDFLSKPLEIEDIRSAARRAWRAGELKRKVERYNRLLNIQRETGKLEVIMPIKELLEEILRSAVKTADASGGAIGILSGDKKRVEYIEIAGEKNKVREWSEPYKKKGSLFSDDAQPRIIGGEVDGNLSSGIAGLGNEGGMTVPLLSGDKVTGTLNLKSGPGHKFSEEDLEIIKEFAFPAGGAIKNASDYRELKEADELKTEFIANVSHELRTPIQSMLSSCEIMENKGVEEKNLKMLALLKRNTLRMRRLIVQLLEYSRMEAGLYSIRPCSTDLKEIAEEACQEIKFLGEREGSKIVNGVKESQMVFADPEGVRRVILNLLENALKYGGRGNLVQITSSGQGDMVRVSVKDRGKGIKKRELNKVFGKFYQQEAGKSLTAKNPGLGLGLSMVKSIVEMHGGTVGVKSEKEKGSEFYFFLPSCQKED